MLYVGKTQYLVKIGRRLREATGPGVVIIAMQVFRPLVRE